MRIFLFLASILAQSERRRMPIRVLRLMLLALVFSAFSPAAHAQPVEIGSGVLDFDKVIAPKWVRIDFDPLIAGDHTIRVNSDSSADIRFSVFRLVDAPSPNNKVRIGTSSTSATLAQWTGALDTSEQYYFGIWAASGSGSYIATVETPILLEITSQPADQTVTAGDDAAFAVVANGSGALSYQWYLNGVAITGASSATYNVIATTSIDSGNIYRVDITDDNGTLSSNNATLTVDAVPVLEITSQPADQTVAEGDDATFAVVATGNGALSYQWYLNDVAITGASSATYNVIATTSIDSGNIYRVDITDDNGTFSSNNATLTVDAVPVLEITLQPADQTVAEGDDATFAVVATGNGALSYQWFVNDVAITGATASTLSVVSTSIDDDGNVFRVDVADDNGTLSSAGATLSVDVAILLEIVSQPTDLTVTEGEDATFTVVAIGSGALSYQWYVNDVAITDATADTYSVIATTTADDGNIYRVDITDDNGTLSSDNTTLSVLEIIVPVTVVNFAQGALDSAKVAGPRWIRLDFDSLAAASHTIRVAWDSTANVKFKVFEADGTLISSTVQGANPGVWSGELDADAQYYIGLWSSSGIANYTATIEATVPVSITSQPDDRIVTQGDDATFYVEANGSGTLSYQWFADGTALAGETADSLTIFTTSLIDDGTVYTVEVSNGNDTVVSSEATLTVNEPLVLGLFSQVADTSAWMLDGPAPTLDFKAGANTDAWGKILLRVDDLLLVGGDFEGIKPTRFATPTARPFLAALDAVTGQPVSTFQVPTAVDAVVRALALSPNGSQIYVGGDFGLLILDATTGALVNSVSMTSGNNPGRVFDIAVGDTQLYIGGDFLNIGNTYRANIARLSLNGTLDATWNPKVTHGYNTGRAAAVQSLALSPSGDIVYLGGNFRFIDGTPVLTTAQNSRISMLSLSALDGSVLPERFLADVGNNAKGLTAHDIAVTEFYVIIAWGGPNYVSFHSLDGTRLEQYRAKGDVQALQVVGDHVYVGHHGEFFGTLVNPNPPEAVVSLDPEIVLPFKIHSFRIDDPSFLPEQAWQITGAFGVWGIAAAEDSIWVAGQISLAGSNDRAVDGLVRFPAL